ncbi:MAG: hypothetical protein ABR608_04150 [Pseudonocardiaceae bacterium]
MTTGDPTEAAVLGSEALNGVGSLHSQRVTHALHELRRLSEPHTHLPAVADLRDRIRTALIA